MGITYAFDLVSLIPALPPGRGQRLHLMGQDTLTGGAGGWEQVARPRRSPVPQWTSQPLYQLEVPLRLDGMEFREGTEDHSVEAVVERLLAWARPQVGTSLPQVFYLDGPLKIPASNPRWIITDFSWGDCIRRADRHRIMQEVTITFLEHTVADVLLGPAARARG